MLGKISQYIQENKNYAINLTKTLVSIPTINPPGENYKKIADILRKELHDLKFKAENITVPPKFLKQYGIDPSLERICVLGEWYVNSKSWLHITGHYDVVPAGNDWNFKPFVPIEEKGKIYGRGTEDMKGTIVSYLLALKSLKAIGIKPKFNIQASFVPDEETGGRTGFNWLLENHFIKAHIGISEGYSKNFVAIGNKGIIWAKIVVKGKPAHASRPRNGINAFEISTRISSDLLNLSKKIAKRKTKYPTEKKVDKFATMVIGGKAESGQKVNVVSDTSYFTVDRRILPEENVKKILDEITGIVKKYEKIYPESKIDFVIDTCDKPTLKMPSIYLTKKFSSSIKTVFKKEAKYGILAGGTDLRFLLKKNIPCFGYSASGGGCWHSKDEFVYIQNILDTSKVVASFIYKL